MVARKRFIFPKPLGAEIAQKSCAGFSRIPAEFLSSNRNAGLYACKLQHRETNVGRNRYFNDLSFQEMGNHFAKERRMKNAEMQKVRRLKTQKAREKMQENGVAAKLHDRYCHGCERRDYGCKLSTTTQKPHKVPHKTAFIPRELRVNMRSTHAVNNTPSKSNRIYRSMTHKKVPRVNPKSEENFKTNMDAAEFSILELRQKFNKKSQELAHDAVANPFYSIDQQKQKLRMLNSLIHECEKMTRNLNKAKSTLIWNITWKSKDILRSHPKHLHLKRNCAIRQAELKIRRLPLKRNICVAHKNKSYKGAGLNDYEEMAFSSEEVLEAENEMSVEDTQLGLLPGLGSIFSRAPQVTVETSIANEPEEAGNNNNGAPDVTLTDENDQQNDDEAVENILEYDEHEEIPPPPPYAQIDTPLLSNSKSSSSSTDSNLKSADTSEGFSFGNISTVKSDGPLTSSKRFIPLNLAAIKASITRKRDYVSCDPFDLNLRSEGLIPDLKSHREVMEFFDPFMNEIVEMASLATNENFSLLRFEALVNFVNSVAPRVQVHYPVHKVYCTDILEHVAEMYDFVMAERSELD